MVVSDEYPVNPANTVPDSRSAALVPEYDDVTRDSAVGGGVRRPTS